MPRDVGVLLVAAGQGVRFGTGLPKQFLPLWGRPMLGWSLRAFQKFPSVRNIVLVVPKEWVRVCRGWFSEGQDGVSVVAGGATRLGSVRRGLRVLSPKCLWVMVHDGARPLVSEAVIRRCLQAAHRTGAAVAGIPARETLKCVTGNGASPWVRQTPRREDFWVAQTPQCYRRKILAQALSSFAQVREASDESQLVERAGGRVRMVSGAVENIKVTTPEDFRVAEMFLGNSFAPAFARIGFGYDIHRLVSGRRLFLGGLKIAYGKGLQGHSDGDVLLHAVGDALLGAAALGDLGRYFSSRNPKWKGIASRKILQSILKKLEVKRFRPLQLDVTLVAEEPRLASRLPAIRSSLSRILKMDARWINVKAKSSDGLGPIGRGEAIAAYAVATLAERGSLDPGPDAGDFSL
ncbi:MAG: 2-C-methyl-D-erythritol 4-phosphate cytidylyltransferase [Elusimicrobia bacterium]|nr:2-C-methyl-D-erythritol 4-phosphate cytidylyltransferase [Elusimicrobiota bacterium]